MSSQADMDTAKAPSKALELSFTVDSSLTEVMRLRAAWLRRGGRRGEEGERLLRPHEALYRLDFPRQALSFARWRLRLQRPGRATLTAISQLWTPDLTPLMTRQLLQPAGAFWRAAGDPRDAPASCLEADMREFGERIAEMAKVRKVGYFLLAFEEGAEASGVHCSIEFTET